MLKKIPVILGPTCSWKSAVAMAVAKHLDGEIISCDSMQIYHGLAIGTAQPSIEERQAVPHHLIDELPITEIWNADKFVPAAHRLIGAIRQRGKTPVVVGGTGMYAKSLCYDMALLPGDPAVSRQLREILNTPDGPECLRKELRQGVGENQDIPRDLWQNPRRVARAVEVLRLTGKAPWQLHPETVPPRPDFLQFCILPEFAMLKQRIARRCRQMLDRGWIDECRAAVQQGLLTTPTAWQALGYRDIHAFLKQHPSGDTEELAVLLTNRTIQYARRQLTWFRHQHHGAVMLEVFSEDDALEYLTAQVLEQYGRSLNAGE